MGMRENPASGYVLPISALAPLYEGELREKFDSLVEDYDREGMSDFLNVNLPDEFPPFTEVYIPADEDTVDGEALVQGEMYLIFDETDLFERKKSPALVALEERLSTVPQYSRWSVWG